MHFQTYNRFVPLFQCSFRFKLLIFKGSKVPKKAAFKEKRPSRVILKLKINHIEDHRLAVLNFFGTFTSIVCGFPFLFSCTFMDDLSFDSRDALASSLALVTSLPSNDVIISSALMPAFSAADPSSTSRTLTPLPSSVS